MNPQPVRAVPGSIPSIFMMVSICLYFNDGNWELFLGLVVC